MDITGFSKVIQAAEGKHRFSLEEIIKLILVQRFDSPSSKLRTCERQEEHGFQGIDLQHIYRSMDILESLDDSIQKQAFDTVCKISGRLVDCFFFDVTTLYFESVSQDELRDFGFDKFSKVSYGANSSCSRCRLSGNTDCI